MNRARTILHGVVFRKVVQVTGLHAYQIIGLFVLSELLDVIARPRTVARRTFIV